MNSGATSLRVYDALKRRILELVHRPGERLDPGRLGEELYSSVTPVRDALHILVGERLVEARPGDGFHVMPIDAPALQDLYEWNSQVLLLSVSAVRAESALIGPAEPEEGLQGDAPEARLFAALARLSPNAEHAHTVASLNDRLHAARLVEARFFSDREAELLELRGIAAGADRTRLRRAILAYHRRRHRAASTIVRALYRQS